MFYKSFQNLNLSALGFGAMRLPTLADGTIDEGAVTEMVRYAMEQGVNYFDTAYPYHGGQSEVVMGRVLGAYPRDSYYLADKYPGHQLMSDGYDPKVIFEEQLKKCGVDYFDFYLLHNVHEKSIETYLDPQWGIIDYFKEQKRLGRIRHLGFSTHAELPTLTRFLDAVGEDMEFCQIQLNYLDWTLQSAKEKVELLKKHNIPVWVMEPVRGGALANLTGVAAEKLKSLRPEESIASWGFRFLHKIPNVTMILSGMSNFQQMEDNVKTFSGGEPLSDEEWNLLLDIAEGMKNSIPCTGCRYCVDGCPQGLDIPALIRVYNEMRFSPNINSAIRVEFLPEDKKPTACLSCGACTQICPQHIDVPAAMKSLADHIAKLPSWAEVSRQREEIAKKGKQ